MSNTNLEKLESFTKESPDEILISGKHENGKYYIRPLNWAGIWKQGILSSGDVLAFFDDEDMLNTYILENKLNTMK